MSQRRESVPGSGLPLPAYLAVLTLSVGLFLVYQGVLWHASKDASHVGRFVVSYLVVVPAAAIALLFLGRFTWSRLVTAAGSMWAIKMILTWGLYEVLAPGTASSLVPAMPHGKAAQASGYQAASGAQNARASGRIDGVVKLDGAPIANAVVMLDGPPPGLATPASSRVDLAIEPGKYLAPLTLAFADDEIHVRDADDALHTVHVQGGARPTNRAATKGSEVSLHIDETGVYSVRCDNHPTELAWIVVVDHPYAARTDANGRFALTSVPAGKLRVVALAPLASRELGRANSPVDLADGATTEMTLEIHP